MAALPRIAKLEAELSARQVPSRGQAWLAAGMLFALIFGLLFWPTMTWVGLLALSAVVFLCVAALRLIALCHTQSSRNTLSRFLPPGEWTLGDDDLPSYAILVPLYAESEVVGDILKAIAGLNYPSDLLEVFLVLEASDAATRRAVEQAALADNVRIVVVPDVPPRTKPAALNHALRYVSSGCLVVYDAEDLPEPNQLRVAAELLKQRPEVGCVQSCLNVYNRNESFFSRQFAIEYTAFFDCLLPALGRLGFPLPLGGTSNHFRRQVLLDAGGWGAYNVTENADLGVRLARCGYRVAVSGATTWEEAPVRFSGWLGQRTRWLKV